MHSVNVGFCDRKTACIHRIKSVTDTLIEWFLVPPLKSC